jgi:hypothetical protein
MNIQNDKLFRKPKAGEKLETGDRMRRATWDYGSESNKWFAIRDFDCGKECDYFRGSHFIVEKLIRGD